MYVVCVKTRTQIPVASFWAIGAAVYLVMNASSVFGRQPERPQSDTVAVVNGVAPPFYLIPGWETMLAQHSPITPNGPAEFAIERLCQFHGRPYDPSSVFRASPSPLAWPRAFAAESVNARLQRIALRAMLDGNGLDVREVIPLDLKPSALADSIAGAIALDHPVLFNSPDAAIAYGYDRREPDHWWWIDRAGTPEILLESERNVQFTFWSDDPAAGIIWLVTGSSQTPAVLSDSLGWVFLGRTVRSVQGNEEEGVEPYPLTLRRFRDMLASTDSLPLLATPIVSDDPLGIKRAKAAREYLLTVLLTVASGSKQSDTSVTQPLRLAEYHLHSAIDALASMSLALYGSAPGNAAMDSLQVNWNGIRARREALEQLSELLKSEKLALESLGVAVTAHEKSVQRPATSRTRRRR